MFHDEKDQLLQAGLSVSQYVHADDTGARHNGKNGYCTHIGNELFAWFGSTEGKNRINFLGCLGQGKAPNYVLNAGALEYMARQKLPLAIVTRIEDSVMAHSDPAVLEAWLDGQGIKAPRHRKTITEGLLMGGLLAQGIPATLAIISDDAGQFNVFDHALCWIHAERIINRLIPLNGDHLKAVEAVREQLWSIYRDLKAYKLNPDPGQVKCSRPGFKRCAAPKQAMQCWAKPEGGWVKTNTSYFVCSIGQSSDCTTT